MKKHRPTSRRAAAALPLVLGMAACAPAIPPGPALLPAAWTPPRGQRCEPGDAPRQLPSVDQVVDSAALAGELGGAGGGHALFTLGYDSLGVADTVRLAGGDLADGDRGAWLRAVSGRVRRRSPFPVELRRGRPQGWSVLLRVEPGAAPAMRIGRAEHCPPVLTNGMAVTEFARQSYNQYLRQNPGDRRAVTVPVKMRVDSLGRVVYAEPLASGAMRPVQDLAVRVAAQAEFLPVLLNRRPVAAWVTLPITFNVLAPRSLPQTTTGRRQPRL